MTSTAGRRWVSDDVKEPMIILAEEICRLKLLSEAHEQRLKKLEFSACGKEPPTPRALSLNNPVDDDVLQAQRVTMLEWTGKNAFQLVFDSKDAGLDVEQFHHAVQGVDSAAVYVFTDQNDVFGGFVGAPVERPREFTTDPGHFIFSLQCNGRVPTPKRWFQKAELREKPTAVWMSQGCNCFIGFGGCSINIDRRPNESYCLMLENSYDGIGESLLTGTKQFTVRRIVVVRLVD